MSSRQSVLIFARQPSAVLSGKKPHPGDQQIAVRAYEIFLRRGETSGSDEADWLEAEREPMDKN